MFFNFRPRSPGCLPNCVVALMVRAVMSGDAPKRRGAKCVTKSPCSGGNLSCSWGFSLTSSMAPGIGSVSDLSLIGSSPSGVEVPGRGSSFSVSPSCVSFLLAFFRILEDLLVGSCPFFGFCSPFITPQDFMYPFFFLMRLKFGVREKGSSCKISLGVCAVQTLLWS